MMKEARGVDVLHPHDQVRGPEGYGPLEDGIKLNRIPADPDVG